MDLSNDVFIAMLGLAVTEISLFESKQQVLQYQMPKCGCQRVKQPRTLKYDASMLMRACILVRTLVSILWPGQYFMHVHVHVH